MKRVNLFILGLGSLTLFAFPGFAQDRPLKTARAVAPMYAPLTAQEKLDAIRHSLVEATLKTPTKVQSTSWFDTNGSLRESSSFKNGMQVQGLRVLSYNRDEAGQPQARLELEEPNPSLRQQTRQGIHAIWQTFTKALQLKQLGFVQNKNEFSENITQLTPALSKSCGKQLKVGLRHMMGVEIWIDDSNPSPLTTTVYQLMGEHLTNSNPINAPQAWRMTLNDTQASMANNMTAYERELTSNKPTQMPWHGTFAMKTEMLPAPGLAGLSGAKGPSMNVSLLLQVSPRAGQKNIFQEMVTLNLEFEVDPWKPAKLKSESYAALDQQFQNWKKSLSELVACEPVTPSVTEVKSESIRINAGSESGIRKGDEWLVADPAKFPSQLVSNDGASQMLLAKVESVTPYQSVLTILAGPAELAQQHWRAWPAETLLKEAPVSPAPKGSFGLR
jgi:hypothetical protein